MELNGFPIIRDSFGVSALHDDVKERRFNRTTVRAALALTATGKHRDALNCYRELVEHEPRSGELRVRLGHALRIMGSREESTAAFRKAIECDPTRGDAYWGLANLGGFRFSAADIEAMQALLARSDLSGENRVYLHFALGRALGSAELWEESFGNYARANAIRRIGVAYDPETTTSRVAHVEEVFTAEYFRERTGTGCASRDPIFVVGMQRSGSTLVEQILSSHSAIEGAGELPDLPQLADALEHAQSLRSLDETALRELGERYLKATLPRRVLGRPFFVDKQPFNFWHTGLIRLILPNARIVDVRRHPLACCFSNFSTLLGHEQQFAYRLSDLGRAYRDYTRLMAHFDRLFPGKIYRVNYELLIAEPEGEIRRLLDSLDLPFEEACLRFHENVRAFDSVSNEQVRRPLFAEAVAHWRNYEPWLGPLKSALGPAIES
ncbi:MAG TPA: sulfotransferase [Rhizomicrobium sp.]|jgi:tetratricopeptide (TPR) repeat protein